MKSTVQFLHAPKNASSHGIASWSVMQRRGKGNEVHLHSKGSYSSALTYTQSEVHWTTAGEPKGILYWDAVVIKLGHKVAASEGVMFAWLALFGSLNPSKAEEDANMLVIGTDLLPQAIAANLVTLQFDRVTLPGNRFQA